MSVKAMSIVWANFDRGGSEKLVLLALADWANDDGGSLHPSMAAIARKSCVSMSQARRIVRSFEDGMLLEVVGNNAGGAPGTTRRYQLHLDRIPLYLAHRQEPGTASTDARPSIGARPSTHAREGSHGCAQTASTGASQTISRTTKNREGVRVRETSIPENFSPSARVKAWAEAKGHDRLDQHCEAFVSKCRAKGYRYVDWDHAFMEAIRKDWADLGNASKRDNFRDVT